MIALTEEQQALRELAARFAAEKLAPTAREDDEQALFHPEIMRELGALGLSGITTPEAHGGAGLGYLEFCLVLEELAAAQAGYAVALAVTGLPQLILTKFGNDDQRRRYLPDLTAGKTLGAFALTEPGSGSDAAAMSSNAVRDGDGWVLNGVKRYITQAGYADVYVVMAQTDGGGRKSVSAFMVDKDTPGVTFGADEDKMGLRSSPTREVYFEDVRLPVGALVGEVGDGMKAALTALDSGRVTIAATAVGISRAALEVALGYSRERQAFGKPIGEFQGVSFLLADMATAVEIARLMTHRAARLRDEGGKVTLAAAQAKLVATDTAMRVTTDAVQVLGGAGYMKDYPLERYMREAKVMQIVEGTNQIQRLVIARELVRGLD